MLTRFSLSLFLALSPFTYSQPGPTPSGVDCFAALSQLNTYLEASENHSRNKLLAGELSQSEFDSELTQLESLRSTYTMSACMDQQFENTFRCFTTSSTDLALCAK